MILEDKKDNDGAFDTIKTLLLNIKNKNVFKEYPDIEKSVLVAYDDIVNAMYKTYMFNDNINPLKEEKILNNMVDFISELKMIDNASD